MAIQSASTARSESARIAALIKDSTYTMLEKRVEKAIDRAIAYGFVQCTISIYAPESEEHVERLLNKLLSFGYGITPQPENQIKISWEK